MSRERYNELQAEIKTIIGSRKDYHDLCKKELIAECGRRFKGRKAKPPECYTALEYLGKDGEAIVSHYELLHEKQHTINIEALKIIEAEQAAILDSIDIIETESLSTVTQSREDSYRSTGAYYAKHMEEFRTAALKAAGYAAQCVRFEENGDGVYKTLVHYDELSAKALCHRIIDKLTIDDLYKFCISNHINFRVYVPMAGWEKYPLNC